VFTGSARSERELSGYGRVYALREISAECVARNAGLGSTRDGSRIIYAPIKNADALRHR